MTSQAQALAELLALKRYNPNKGGYPEFLPRFLTINVPVELFERARAALEAPGELNLNCKSEQKRLATLWGFVPASPAEQARIAELEGLLKIAVDALHSAGAEQKAEVVGSIPSEQQILQAAEEAGLWPNTVHHWTGAFQRYHAAINRMLVASPPPPAVASRGPLTDSEIENLWAGASDPESAEMSIYTFARAIEAAHDIPRPPITAGGTP